MKGVLAIALLGAAVSGSSVASPVSLRFSSETDGNRYDYFIAEDGTYTDSTEYGVGALGLRELVEFDWDVSYTDDQTSDLGAYTIRYFHTVLTTVEHQLENGLLSEGLALDFVPSTSDVNRNVSGTLSWTSRPDGSSYGQHDAVFDISISWEAMGFDEFGALHHLSYGRMYTFVNYTLLSSEAELGTFTEDMFWRLALHPETHRLFQETVQTSTYHCSQPDLCGRNGSRVYALYGSFDFVAVSAVSEPGSLIMFGFGGLLLIGRVKRKQA